MKGIKLMNKLNIIPGFKEGGVGTIAKELEIDYIDIKNYKKS